MICTLYFRIEDDQLERYVEDLILKVRTKGNKDFIDALNSNKRSHCLLLNGSMIIIITIYIFYEQCNYNIVRSCGPHGWQNCGSKGLLLKALWPSVHKFD